MKPMKPMKPMSMICAVSGMLVLAFSATAVSAGSVTVHTTTPPVTVHPTVTPKFQSLATGKHIPRTTLTLRKAGGGPYDDKTKGGDSTKATVSDLSATKQIDATSSK
jgi:hypothetical protein